MSFKKLLIVIFTALATVAGVFAFMVWALGAMLSGGRNNELLKEIPSPDRKCKAVIFQRDCGATTGFSTQVSLLPIDKNLPNDFGNVFRADTDHGEAPTGPGGGPVVEVRWSGDNELVITHDSRARIFHSENAMKDIIIKYEAKNQ